MQNALATILLLTSSVILCCFVIDYAVGVVQATIQTDNIPQVQRLRNMESSVLNQTDNLFNQTLTQEQNAPPP